MLKFVRGDMFETPADVRVNTVNCAGVMGAGVALLFKTRYPEMFRAYKRACDTGEMRPGQVHVWKTLHEWIVNFPTKRHWRDKSRYEDIDSGLTSLRDYLAKHGAVRVTLPALGCGHGGLEWSRVSEMIRARLQDLDAEIFVFEPGDSIAAGERAAATILATAGATEFDADALAKRLGRRAAVLSELGVERAFVKGNTGLLAHGWLAIVPSEKAAMREEAAALACTDAIARSGITTALRHGGQLSRRLCEATLARDANVVLWAAEGVNHVRFPQSLLGAVDRGKLLVISVANPMARWTTAAAARAALLQIELAQAVLITDPEPEWPPRLAGRLGLSNRPAIFYVRYGNESLAAISRLRHDGARPVAKDPRTGLPRTAPVLAALGVPA